MSAFVERLSRRLFMTSLTVVVLGGAFTFGALAYQHDLPPIPQVRAAYDTVRDNDLRNHPRRFHLQPSRGQGEGVTVNDAPDDGGLVLMAGFFDDENQIRLVRRDGTVVRKWSLDYFEHFPDRGARPCDLSSPLRVDTHGVHATARGEVVFNYEYCGTVKLDDCGDLIWSIGDDTHHALVPATDGGYWVLGRDRVEESGEAGELTSLFTSAHEPVLEDTIVRVDDEGQVLDEISIPEVMVDNGLEALLSVNPASYPQDVIRGGELVHANKVTELSSEIAEAYPLFEPGDVAISLRGRNLVMVLDPATREVKWHQTGPWIRQHDPEFRADGRLSIFNNNVYGTAYADDQTVEGTPYTTNIVAVDPVTGETEVVFGEAPGQEMLSVIRGGHQLLDDGGMLITEFDGGRVLQVDADGEIVWEYVNAYDDDHVGEITDALLFPGDYFEGDWGTCMS